MATIAPRADGKPHPRNYRIDQGFFFGISLALVLLTLLGFGQLAARGITDPVSASARVHVHALLLVAWLALFCTQNWLAWTRRISTHRKLGWISLGLVAAILLANYTVTVDVIVEGRMGPGFTPASFLALGTADTLTFAGLIAWALAKRRDTQWHRRLMFGATLMIAAAGINRLLRGLPPDISEFSSIAAQLAFIAVIAWHDRRMLGHVHKATLVLVLMVAIQRSLPILLPQFDPWVDLANRLVT